MIERNIDITGLPVFDGGWSYASESILNTFRRVTYINDDIRVLEFGGGSSSQKIFTFLKSKILNVEYDCYETNPTYAPPLPINTIMYDTPENVTTLDKIYDLIMVDGPYGECRKFWYNKIKKNCRSGTIVLIDDWNHYRSFEDELNKHLKYDILEETHGRAPLHSWKIVRII